MKLFHGTSDVFLKAIEKEGLRNAYLTDLEAMAAYFAGTAVEEHGGSPVILVINVKDTGCLIPDDEMYAEPLTYVMDAHEIGSDSEWHEALEHGTLQFPRHARDWKTSLETVNSVICDGRIPWKQVVRILDAGSGADRGRLERFEDPGE